MSPGSPRLAARILGGRGIWAAGLLLWLLVGLLVGLLAARGAGLLPPSVAALLGDPMAKLQAELTLRKAALAGLSCTPTPDIAAKPPLPQPDPTALSHGDLASRLEQSTVLVLTEDGSGSGFFISPSMVVTNRHVVERHAADKVLVTSKSLGRVIAGKIVAITPKNPLGAPDFAVIDLATPVTDGKMSLAGPPGKLQPIIVAGYPGLVIGSDQGFRRLLAGDPTAAPDLTVIEGSISGTQLSAYQVTMLLHSANVLRGNSGGPLVDACGRVVGINSFIAVDAEQSGHINYALGAEDLAKFLTASKIAFQHETTPCH